MSLFRSHENTNSYDLQATPGPAPTGIGPAVGNYGFGYRFP